MVEAIFKPVFVPAGSDSRVTIPHAWCERIPWVFGDETLLVWLLMLLPGRFRILSDTEVQQNPGLNDIRSRIVNGPSPTEVPPTAFDRNEIAILVGRLIPTTLAPGGSWRLIVPRQIVPGDRDRKQYVLLFSSGYLELWFAETYNDALLSPLDAIIRE
jgi:hypothetical protein